MLDQPDRPNLKVLTGATARRVIFKEGLVSVDSSDDGVIQADGVEFEHTGAVHVVHAKREVVLTAGYGIKSFN